MCVCKDVMQLDDMSCSVLNFLKNGPRDESILFTITTKTIKDILHLLVSKKKGHKKQNILGSMRYTEIFFVLLIQIEFGTTDLL